MCHQEQQWGGGRNGGGGGGGGNDLMVVERESGIVEEISIQKCITGSMTHQRKGGGGSVAVSQKLWQLRFSLINVMTPTKIDRSLLFLYLKRMGLICRYFIGFVLSSFLIFLCCQIAFIGVGGYVSFCKSHDSIINQSLLILFRILISNNRDLLHKWGKKKGKKFVLIVRQGITHYHKCHRAAKTI